MKILGIGVDIFQNRRINHLIKNKKFVERVFSKNEIKNSKKLKKKIEFFSKRYAAKESLAKALGTGFRNNLHFKDIEINNDKNGRPFFMDSKKISNIIHNRFKVKRYNLLLSISDEKDYSIAFTIIQKK